MLTRTNTKNKDELSILGFGCMRFPTKNGTVDEDASIALIRECIHKGINYFDTAYFYNGGKSESILGKALSGGYRANVKVATKLPPFMVSKLQGAQKIFSTQLSRLQTEYIDYYLLHMLSDINELERMKSLGVIDWLEELKKQGIIKNLGFSFHGSKMDFEQLITAYPWDFCQIQYNYLDVNNQAGISGLQLAYSLGIPVIVMEPLRGGRLADRLPKEVLHKFHSYDKDSTPVEWALKWVWNHPQVTVVLSGMSNEEQLEENTQIACDMIPNSLSDKELEVFDRVMDIMHEKTKIPCTSCGYCMPCPFGVNIPGCFSVYNDKYLLREKRNKIIYIRTLGGLSKQAAYASICTECGKCEKHCPQKIEIRRELKRVKKEMENPFLNTSMKIIRRFMRISN
ncbi:MAG: aldo/keto reductase [Anaerolineaceae bacterium]|nr:MAG: aldo/keto reductase [Anaerolineaceae bacterium]